MIPVRPSLLSGEQVGFDKLSQDFNLAGPPDPSDSNDIEESYSGALEIGVNGFPVFELGLIDIEDNVSWTIWDWSLSWTNKLELLDAADVVLSVITQDISTEMSFDDTGFPTDFSFNITKSTIAVTVAALAAGFAKMRYTPLNFVSTHSDWSPEVFGYSVDVTPGIYVPANADAVPRILVQ